jgi:hypothetical protein
MSCRLVEQEKQVEEMVRRLEESTAGKAEY